MSLSELVSVVKNIDIEFGIESVALLTSQRKREG